MPINITIRDATKKKLEAIAGHDRRSIIETVDVLADAYMAFKQIQLPPATKTDARQAE